MKGDRVAAQRGWMQDARVLAKAGALQTRATPQTAPLHGNPKGSPSASVRRVRPTPVFWY